MIVTSSKLSCAKFCRESTMRPYLLFISLLLTFFCYAQEQSESALEEQLMENLTASSESEVEDDSKIQLYDFLRRHRLSINTASREELQELAVLSEIQIEKILDHRKLFGDFVSIYELQAVVGLDISSIRKLLPFIVLNKNVASINSFRKRFSDGEHNLLLRTSMTLEQAKGFRPGSSGVSAYAGGREKIFLRYSYKFKRLLEYGILGEKDPGEEFFKGQQRYGFDFYSFYLFARKIGWIESLVLGDFTISMGQGLIQAQGLSLRKSSAILSSRSLGETIKPYHSAGEFNFHRGVGVTLKRLKFSSTFFVSKRQHTANLDADTLGSYVTSISSSGYHRTVNEMGDKSNLNLVSVGSVLKYHVAKGHVGINMLHYRFSHPMRRSNSLYDLFSISGKQWANYSFDYAFTLKNLHAYGEAAVDKQHKLAVLQGLMITLSKSVDLAVVYRNLSPAYQSLFSTTFSESSTPGNEHGLFLGLSLRPASHFLVEGYADFYQNPWLKFRASFPSFGYDYVIRITYTPDKQTEIFASYKYERSGANQVQPSLPLRYVHPADRSGIRLQLSHQANKFLSLKSRIELSSFNGETGSKASQQAFLAYADIHYQPSQSILSGAFRLQYFDTDGYESRLYSYETGMLSDFSIPSYFNTGWRYYLNLKTKLNSNKTVRKIFGKMIPVFTIRISQTLMQKDFEIGSGNDLLDQSRKTEVKLQLLLTW